MTVALPRPRVPRAALVALCRRRLAASVGARLGWGAAVLVVAGAWGLVAWGFDAEQGREIDGVLRRALAWLPWLALGPAAVSMANGAEARDRRDGVELLAQLRGATRGDLLAARVAAAAAEASLRLALPALALGVIAAAALRRAALGALAQALALGGFAALGGLVFGAVAAFCGHWGGRRGVLLLALVVLGPWALANHLGEAVWSLPGALDELFGFAWALAAGGGA
ncbi:MAG: hypothetical protein HY744_33715 [Deltaproteobacteria bacterium]|nr:hypothetical protein [Deltaproteobacteria bacterium]